MGISFDFDWSGAEQLLLKRDRHTEDLIKKDFRLDPLKEGTVEIDPTRHRYVTPVAGNRYVVVWDQEQNPGGKLARVRAVVPTQLTSDNPEQVRAQVKDVVEYESKGKIRLE